MLRLIGWILFANIFLFATEIKVDLNKAIKLALDNNALNRISKLNLQIAQAQYHQALSANYPSLDAVFYASRDKKDTTFQQRGYFSLSSELSKTLTLANTLAITDPATRAAQQAYISSLPASAFPEGKLTADIDAKAKGRDTSVSSLELNYPIYTGGKISSIIEQARLNKEIKREAIIRDRTKVIFDVKKYFYGYVLMSELYELVDSIYENMSFSEDLAKEFLENGSTLKIKKTDYLNLKLLTSLLNSTRSTIELNKEMLRSALSNSLGLNYKDRLEIEYSNQEIIKQNSSLQELIKKASTLNPDINSINLALKIKEEQIKESGSEYYPMVNLFANASHTYNSYEYGYLNEDESNKWSIGIAIKMSLFNGFKTKNTLVEKRLEKKRTQEQKVLLEEAVALQLKNEFLKSTIGYKQIEILKSAVSTAKENSEMNFKGYKYEVVEAEDLVESQLMEVYVKGEYLKNVHDYLLSLATIDKIIGESLEEKF